jgi:hypothetical protein
LGNITSRTVYLSAESNNNNGLEAILNRDRPTDGQIGTNSDGVVGTTDTYANWAKGSNKDDQFPCMCLIQVNHDLTILCVARYCATALEVCCSGACKRCPSQSYNPDEFISVGNGTLKFNDDGTLNLGASGIAALA